MTILEQVYASGGNDVRILTVELLCDSWGESIKMCNGFYDQTVLDESVVEKTFTAAGIEVALPEKNNIGTQNITFAVDNVTGEAQQKIMAALEDEAMVTLVYREYLASNLTEPAAPPCRMTVTGGALHRNTVQIHAGFFNLIGVACPRDKYTTTFAPGLRYIA